MGKSRPQTALVDFSAREGGESRRWYAKSGFLWKWEFESPRPHHNPHFMCHNLLIHKHCVNHVAWSVEQIAYLKSGLILR